MYGSLPGSILGDTQSGPAVFGTTTVGGEALIPKKDKYSWIRCNEFEEKKSVVAVSQ